MFMPYGCAWAYTLLDLYLFKNGCYIISFWSSYSLDEDPWFIHEKGETLNLGIIVQVQVCVQAHCHTSTYAYFVYEVSRPTSACAHRYL